MVNGDGYGKRNDGHSAGTSNGTVMGMVYGKPYIVLAMAAVMFVAMVVFNRRHPTPSPHLTGFTRLLELVPASQPLMVPRVAGYAWMKFRALIARSEHKSFGGCILGSRSSPDVPTYVIFCRNGSDNLPIAYTVKLSQQQSPRKRRQKVRKVFPRSFFRIENVIKIAFHFTPFTKRRNIVLKDQK